MIAFQNLLFAALIRFFIRLTLLQNASANFDFFPLRGDVCGRPESGYKRVASLSTHSFDRTFIPLDNHPPYFARSLYTGAIKENNAVGELRSRCTVYL